MLKVIEVNINMGAAQAGATAAAIEAAVNALPNGSKFLSATATPSVVYLFCDVPAHWWNRLFG